MPQGGPGSALRSPQTHGTAPLTPARYAVPLPTKLRSMWPSGSPSASTPVRPCTRWAYRAASAAGCGQTGGHGRAAQRPRPAARPSPAGRWPPTPAIGWSGRWAARRAAGRSTCGTEGRREGTAGGRVVDGRTAPDSLADGIGGEEHRAALQLQGGGPWGTQRGRRRLCGTVRPSGEGDRGGRAARRRPRPPPPNGPGEGLTSGLGPAELHRSAGAVCGRHHLQRRGTACRHPQPHGSALMQPETRPGAAHELSRGEFSKISRGEFSWDTNLMKLSRDELLRLSCASSRESFGRTASAAMVTAGVTS